MAKVRSKSTPEFKLRALAMMTDQHLSVAEVAHRLGMSENRLPEWKKAVLDKGADAFPVSGHQTPIARKRTAVYGREQASNRR